MGYRGVWPATGSVTLGTPEHVSATAVVSALVPAPAKAQAIPTSIHLRMILAATAVSSARRFNVTRSPVTSRGVLFFLVSKRVDVLQLADRQLIVGV